MNNEITVCMRVLSQIARERKWSKHKYKSLRGQILSMKTQEEREAYLRKVASAR